MRVSVRVYPDIAPTSMTTKMAQRRREAGFRPFGLPRLGYNTGSPRATPQQEITLGVSGMKSMKFAAAGLFAFAGLGALVPTGAMAARHQTATPVCIRNRERGQRERTDRCHRQRNPFR